MLLRKVSDEQFIEQLRVAQSKRARYIRILAAVTSAIIFVLGILAFYFLRLVRSTDSALFGDVDLGLILGFVSGLLLGLTVFHMAWSLMTCLMLWLGRDPADRAYQLLLRYYDQCQRQKTT